MLAGPLHAAGNAQLLISPSRTSVAVGESFSVTATINPGGSPIDTARAQITFPANLVQARSASLIGKLSSALPNNFIDNGNGTLSWGGYGIQTPISSTGGFVRIVFEARAEGSAQITTTGASRLVSQGQEMNSGVVSATTVNIGGIQPGGVSVDGLTVNSPSHPDPTLWYAKDLVQLEWSGPQYVGYLYGFDQEPDAVPTQETTSQSKIYKRVKSGVHYFHIRAKRADGTLTSVINFPVQVDTVTPNKFSPYLEADTDGNLTVRFATTDNHSGIDRYMLSINGGQPIAATSPYAFDDVPQGENIVIIDAYDQAGNVTRGWIKFFVNADGTFRIIGHSQRGCDSSLLCLPALLSKPVVGGVMLVLILLLILLVLRRKKRRHGDT